jgi:hypothetical protein
MKLMQFGVFTSQNYCIIQLTTLAYFPKSMKEWLIPKRCRDFQVRQHKN